MEVCKEKMFVFQILPEFNAFKTAIADCLKQTHSTYKLELDSLLSCNFQLFEKLNYSPLKVYVNPFFNWFIRTLKPRPLGVVIDIRLCLKTVFKIAVAKA